MSNGNIIGHGLKFGNNQKLFTEKYRIVYCVAKVSLGFIQKPLATIEIATLNCSLVEGRTRFFFFMFENDLLEQLFLFEID